MLIQSHLDYIYLLPAIPDEWSEGDVKGLRARGGFEFDMQWENKQLSNIRVKSLNGNICKIRTDQPVKLEGTDVESTSSEIGYIISFDTEKGESYTLSSNI